jgi:neutral ceramidase
MVTSAWPCFPGKTHVHEDVDMAHSIKWYHYLIRELLANPAEAREDGKPPDTVVTPLARQFFPPRTSRLMYLVSLRRLAIVVGLTLVVGLSSNSVSLAQWKAGAASVKITPETSLWMAGYAGRNKPSEGVALDLYAKALAVEDDKGTRLVIVTLDLIGVPRFLRDWLEAEVQQKYQLPRDGLLMNASHTHCGPELRVTRLADDGRATDIQKAGAAYVEDLKAKLSALVGDSLKNLAPAKLDYQHARCGFAMNRRRPTEKGPTNAPHSDGPVDHSVPVLRVTGDDGKVKAVLFTYACHNTTLGFYQFCGDYAGYAQQCLEADLPGTVALFMTGCGGDQNPYPRGKIELAQQHGRSLANSVLAALDTVPKPVVGPLRPQFAEIQLDFAPPASREQLMLEAEGKREPHASHARRLLKQLQETGKIRDMYTYPIHVVDWGGNFVMIALAGETVIDYTLRFKRELASHQVWVAGYSNDVFGYVPSLRVLQEGGYEGGGAMLYGSLPGPFAPSVEEKIVSKVLELAKPIAVAR